jgi:hypothetical protein
MWLMDASCKMKIVIMKVKIACKIIFVLITIFCLTLQVCCEDRIIKYVLKIS